MFFTSAWCIDNEENFRKKIPLEILGESLLRFGSTIKVDVVLLEGRELLSDDYIQSLEKLGFVFTDYSNEFKSIITRFPEIDKQYVRYERNCFLRWIAFKEIIEKRNAPGQQCWHIDSDIVMHTSLDELAAVTKGKTFMLQGCPVLTSIASFEWFNLYGQQLKMLNDDITGFSQIAWEQRPALMKTDGPMLNQTSFRNPIGSDQDLLQYLVGSGRIPQASREAVYDSPFYYAQNALILGFIHAEQVPEGTRFSMNEKGEILAGKKRVPFIHYQNTFAAYAETYIYLKKLGLPEGLLKWILSFKQEGEHFKIGLAYKLVNKFRYHLGLLTNRKKLMLELSQQNTKYNIVAVLNFLSVITRNQKRS